MGRGGGRGGKGGRGKLNAKYSIPLRIPTKMTSDIVYILSDCLFV